MASITNIQLLIITISAFASTEKCTNPLPALMQMESGVDITAVDLFPIGDPPEQRGLLENVLNFTCSGMTIGRRLRIKGDEFGFNYYDLPDQITEIVMVYSISTRITPIMLDWDQVREVFSSSFNLDEGSYSEEALGAFARSTKYTSLLKQHFGSNKAFYDIGTRSEELVLRIESIEKSTLSQEFLDFITHQLPPRYEDNPAAYETFIKRFGTHYFAKAYISNYDRVQFALSQDYLLDTNDTQIGDDMDASYKNYFNDTLTDSKNVSNSSEVVLAYSTLNSESSLWLDKITGVQYRSSQFTGFSIHEAELRQIEKLIDNKTIQAQVKIAVRMHRIRAQLEELNNIYNFTSDYYQLSSEDKVAIENVIKLIDSCDIKQMDKMVSIISELYHKAKQFTDKFVVGRIIDDFYVTASTKLEFAKQVCPLLAMKHPKEQRLRCPDQSIMEVQNATTKLYEDYYERGHANAFGHARELNQQYGLRADITNGLRASCGDC